MVIINIENNEKKKSYIIYGWHVLQYCYTVAEDVETHKPYGDGSGHAPGTVQVTSYEQIPGGVTLKFIAPTDEDLLYIKINNNT